MRRRRRAESDVDPISVAAVAPTGIPPEILGRPDWGPPYAAWNGSGDFGGWWQQRRVALDEWEYRRVPGMEGAPAPAEPRWLH